MNNKKKFIEIPDEAIIRGSSKKDIYYDNKIYIGHNGKDGLLTQDLDNYPVQGSHSFKDGQEVVEGVDYEKKAWQTICAYWTKDNDCAKDYQCNCTRSEKYNTIVAIPLQTPAPVAEQDFNLLFCERCFQMTNNKNGVCQKCNGNVVAELPKEADGNPTPSKELKSAGQIITEQTGIRLDAPKQTPMDKCECIVCMEAYASQLHPSPTPAVKEAVFTIKDMESAIEFGYSQRRKYGYISQTEQTDFLNSKTKNNEQQ